jgi:Bifunctional DNA primase/polymerase, N-terminal/Primase C terminal 1 (PriCT-1)
MKSYRDNTILVHEKALKIAAKGKPVFPCRDKRPLTPRGFKDATVDPAQVNMFWNKHRGAMIGMPTGKRSGVFVVDVDRPEAVGELPGRLPKTRTIRTPRGGRHYYFKHVDGISNSTGTMPDGIDVRGEGGYCILPPSAGYKVIDNSPIADAPSWLLRALRDEPRKPSGPGRSGSSVPDDGMPIPEGSRNRTLFFYALDLKDEGLHHDDVLATTLQANQERCQPPLPETEIESIVKSAMRYPVRSGKGSPEVTEFCDQLEDEWWAAVWKGVGGKTDRDAKRALIEFARRHGRLVEDGQAIEVSVSVRTLALATAAHYVTVSRGVTKRLAQSGGVVKLDNGRRPLEAATWRLYATTVQGANTQHSSGAIDNEMLCVSGSDNGRSKSLQDLDTPAFRWRGLVGKGASGVLYILEAYGPMTELEIAHALGYTRVCDMRRRSYLPRLIELGLVEDRGGTYALYNDHVERVDKVRNMPYSPERSRRSNSAEGRAVVEIDHATAYASEVERETKDIRDHERDQEKYRRYLDELTEVADTSFYDLGVVAAPPTPPAKAERRRPSPRIDEPEETGSPPCKKHHARACTSCAEEFARLARQGYKRRFLLEDMYLHKEAS